MAISCCLAIITKEINAGLFSKDEIKYSIDLGDRIEDTGFALTEYDELLRSIVKGYWKRLPTREREQEWNPGPLIDRLAAFQNDNVHFREERHRCFVPLGRVYCQARYHSELRSKTWFSGNVFPRTMAFLKKCHQWVTAVVVVRKVMGHVLPQELLDVIQDFVSPEGHGLVHSQDHSRRIE